MRDEVIERMCKASNIPPRSEDGWWTNRTGMTAALRVAIDAARRELERNKTDQSDVKIHESSSSASNHILRLEAELRRAEAERDAAIGLIEKRNNTIREIAQINRDFAGKIVQFRQQIEGLSRPVSDEEWKAIPKLMSSLTGRSSYSSRDEVDALLAARAGGKNNEK